ncbi:hypothetical protein Q5P01_000220, partial [Channa striata]
AAIASPAADFDAASKRPTLAPTPSPGVRSRRSRDLASLCLLLGRALEEADCPRLGVRGEIPAKPRTASACYPARHERGLDASPRRARSPTPSMGAVEADTTPRVRRRSRNHGSSGLLSRRRPPRGRRAPTPESATGQPQPKKGRMKSRRRRDFDAFLDGGRRRPVTPGNRPGRCFGTASPGWSPERLPRHRFWYRVKNGEKFDLP